MIQESRILKITEALYTHSASVLKDGILQYVTIEELFELALHPTTRTAFRATWYLEHVLLGKGYNLIEYKEKILYIFSNSNNWSVQRSISKLILALLQSIKLNTLSEEIMEILLNSTFRLLENPHCPVAVRCNLYDIICLLITEQPWLIQEFIHRIELDLAIHETPALRSRANKVLKRLERIAKS